MRDRAEQRLMTIEIRSYRSVFDLERRIYRIDRLQLNPGGVPVRGVVYLIGLLLVALLAAQVPVLGALMRVLPWYLRDLALPVGSAALLTVMRIEGRPFHLAAWALVRYACRPRRLLADRPGRQAPGRRWSPQEVVVLPDGSDSRLRRLRCKGPGSVVVAVAHERIKWRQGPVARYRRRERVTVRELTGRRPPSRTQRITLRAGTRLSVVEAAAQRRVRR